MNRRRNKHRSKHRTFQDCIFHGWRAGADAHTLADTETRQLDTPSAKSPVSCCSPFTSPPLIPSVLRLNTCWLPFPLLLVFLYNTSAFSRKICVIICLNGSGANAWKTQGVSGRRWKDAISHSLEWISWKWLIYFILPVF